MPDVAVAVGREFQKLGRVSGRSEFGCYYEHVLAVLGGGVG
jgi:hypothetical protein